MKELKSTALSGMNTPFDLVRCFGTSSEILFFNTINDKNGKKEHKISFAWQSEDVL